MTVVATEADQLESYRKVFKRLFDPQPAHLALLNMEAVVVETHTAWNQFGIDNGLPATYNCIGINYLGVCEPAAKADILPPIRLILDFWS